MSIACCVHHVSKAVHANIHEYYVLCASCLKGSACEYPWVLCAVCIMSQRQCMRYPWVLRAMCESCLKGSAYDIHEYCVLCVHHVSKAVHANIHEYCVLCALCLKGSACDIHEYCVLCVHHVSKAVHANIHEYYVLCASCLKGSTCEYPWVLRVVCIMSQRQCMRISMSIVCCVHYVSKAVHAISMSIACYVCFMSQRQCMRYPWKLRAMCASCLKSSACEYPWVLRVVCIMFQRQYMRISMSIACCVHHVSKAVHACIHEYCVLCVHYVSKAVHANIHVYCVLCVHHVSKAVHANIHECCVLCASCLKGSTYEYPWVLRVVCIMSQR
jgi:hypothetical protein